MTRAIVALIIFTLVLVSPFVVSAASGDLGDPPLKPDFKANGGIDPDVDECVRDVDEMRANHMVLLKDARVEVVRQGGPEVVQKNEELEVERCFSCHEFEKFCKECHEYNGVKPTCFNETGGCHTNEKLDKAERPDL